MLAAFGIAADLAPHFHSADGERPPEFLRHFIWSYLATCDVDAAAFTAQPVQSAVSQLAVVGAAELPFAEDLTVRVTLKSRDQAPR
jgi:hypothetical protein